MKKLVINTSNLIAILNRLSPVISSRAAVPVLENILCKVDGDQITFVASDLEITLISTVVCSATETFDFLLPYHLATNILKLIKDEEITLEVKVRSLRIIAEHDQYDLKFNSKIEDFPAIPNIDEAKVFSMEAKYIRWLRVAQDTTGKDENKPMFHRVLLELKKTGVTIASSDGSYCLFSYSIPEASENEQNLLIPTRIFKSLNSPGDMQISWNDKFFSLKTALVTAIITMSEYKYVDYRKIIPEGFDTNLHVTKQDLTDAFQKCALSSAILKESTLTLKPASIKFETDDRIMKVNVDVQSKYSGTVEKISLLSDRALTLLKQIEYKELGLAVHNETKAVIFRSEEDKNYLGLLMPLLPTPNK